MLANDEDAVVLSGKGERAVTAVGDPLEGDMDGPQSVGTRLTESVALSTVESTSVLLGDGKAERVALVSLEGGGVCGAGVDGSQSVDPGPTESVACMAVDRDNAGVKVAVALQRVVVLSVALAAISLWTASSMVDSSTSSICDTIGGWGLLA